MTTHGVWHVCDDFSNGSPDADVVVAWNAFGTGDPNRISLPELIRHRRDHYRSRLLGFFREVETSDCGGIDLIEATGLENGPSYWWMTLIFAKRWGELGVLADAVKVLALADLIAEHRPDSVIVQLSDERARRSATGTIRINGVDLQVRGTTTTGRRRWARVRAARTLITSFRFTRSKPAGSTARTVIADYLFRIDPSSLGNGSFRSQYWGDLPTHLAPGVLWLHRFTPHPMIPTRRRARRLIRRFNSTTESDRHELLDDVRGLVELGRVMRRYREIRRLDGRLLDVSASFRTDRVDLWPVFERDWKESFRGSHAMSMAILMTTLGSRVGAVTEPRMGLYIFENQPWESALLHAWRRCHAAPLVAVPHSTIRYWDVRYFVSTDTFDDGRFAQPDLIAANSTAARVALTQGGWSAGRIREVEALMYQYLGEGDPDCGSGNDIVVLGELDGTSTQRYLRFVESTLVDRTDERTVVFKAHPLVDPRSIDMGGLRVEMSTEPVSMLLRRARILVTGASGSTTLEALSRGIPTICVLDPHELDLSSVDEHPILRLVGSESEFHAAMTELIDLPPRVGIAEPMFHVDATLSRWHALLSAVDPRR